MENGKFFSWFTRYCVFALFCEFVSGFTQDIV